MNNINPERVEIIDNENEKVAEKINKISENSEKRIQNLEALLILNSIDQLLKDDIDLVIDTQNDKYMLINNDGQIISHVMTFDEFKNTIPEVIKKINTSEYYDFNAKNNIEDPILFDRVERIISNLITSTPLKSEDGSPVYKYHFDKK